MSRTVSMVLGSLHPLGQLRRPDLARDAIVNVAKTWQSQGTFATAREFHGVTHGKEPGVMHALIGRIASAGEQLGLAWTALQDAGNWLEAGDPDAIATFAARAQVEIAGYFATSTGHALANVTLQTLVLDATAKDHWIRGRRRKAPDPYSIARDSWLSLNQGTAEAILETAGTIQGVAATGASG